MEISTENDQNRRKMLRLSPREDGNLFPPCMQLEIYPVVAAQWLLSCPTAGLGPAHPAAFQGV